MKYYLIAGEASGDLHGSKLMKGLKGSDPDAEFRYFGGDLMEAEGGTLVQHYRQTAVMGLFKVISNLGKISRNLKNCKQDILNYAPDVIILIDYSGFNLRIAKWAKPEGFKVVYYISPKVWVWNTKRVNTIKKNIDRMYVILPFEVEFYRKYNYTVEYVGNPILDAVEERITNPEPRQDFLDRNGLDNTPIIALLAGSRREEIRHCLPEMLAVVKEFPDHQFVIAGAPGIAPEYYNKYIGLREITILFDQTYELLMQSEAAVVTSGTATLETALFNVPEAVVYKMSKATYYIGKQFVKPKFFSLVNLIMDREVVNEILQTRVRYKISDELHKIIEDSSYRDRMLDDFRELKRLLGATGAPERLANLIVEFLAKTRESE